MRSVFFWRSPVKPSAKSLRIRSAPPGFSPQIIVNSFDCPALLPGRALTAVVVIGVSSVVRVVVIGVFLQFDLPICTAGALTVRAGQPFQRAQTGHEAVFASAYGNELRQAVQTAPHRAFANGEIATAVLIAQNRILLGSVTYE